MFYLKRYKMSETFQKQFDAFFRQLREGTRKPLGDVILSLLPFRPKEITEKAWGPH